MSFATGFIAARAKEPTLKLNDDEATQVAEAAANVGKHYNVPISPITQAWLGLGMTVGSIYAGKLAAINMRKRVTPVSRPAPQAPTKPANGKDDDLGFGQPDLSSLTSKLQ